MLHTLIDGTIDDGSLDVNQTLPRLLLHILNLGTKLP